MRNMRIQIPPFLYTVLISISILIAFIVWYLNSVSPSSYPAILGGFLIFFVVLCLILSIPLFFYFYRRAPQYSDIRKIYRKSLKWAVFGSVGVMGVLILRAFRITNLLNLTLFGVFYVALYTQLRHKK